MIADVRCDAPTCADVRGQPASLLFDYSQTFADIRSANGVEDSRRISNSANDRDEANGYQDGYQTITDSGALRLSGSGMLLVVVPKFRLHLVRRPPAWLSPCSCHQSGRDRLAITLASGCS